MIRNMFSQIRGQQEDQPSSNSSVPPTVFHSPKNNGPVVLSQEAEAPYQHILERLLSSTHMSRVICACGMPGSGKTTILRALSHDLQVWHRFPDAVWFIQAGHAKSSLDLRNDLRRFLQRVNVTQAFEKEFFEVFDDSTKQDAAVGLLCTQIFSRFSILLILDDIVYDSNPNGTFAFFRRLSHRLYDQRTDTRSCLLCSTRYTHVAQTPVPSATVRVDALVPMGDTARKILASHAGIRMDRFENLPGTAPAALNHVLLACNGLPMCLAISGAALRSLLASSSESHTSDAVALQSYSDTLRANPARLGAIGTPESNHEYNLFSALETTLQILSNSNIGAALFAAPRRWPLGTHLSVRDRFSSLCVVGKNQAVQLDVMRRCWNTTPGNAREALDVFEQFNLVRTFVDDSGVWFGVHDVVLDYSVVVARQMQSEALWHAQLLASHGANLPRSMVRLLDGSAHPLRHWWSVDVPNRGYIFNNVARHLVLGGLVQEMLCLFADFRWIDQLNRVKNWMPFAKSILELERFTKYLNSCAADEPADMAQTITGINSQLLSMISTFNLCKSRASLKPAETAAQLEGRIVISQDEAAVHTAILSYFKGSVRKHTSLPRVVASPTLMRIEDDGIHSSVLLPDSSNVQEICESHDSSNLVVCASAVWLMDIRSAVVVKQKRGLPPFALVRRAYVSIDFKKCVAICTDGCIRVWGEGELPLKTFKVVEDPEAWIYGVLVDQNKIVFTRRETSVVTTFDFEAGRVLRTKNYDIQFGSASVRTLVGGKVVFTNYQSNNIILVDPESLAVCDPPFIGHERYITLVIASTGGDRIVSGANDGTIRVWDVPSRVALLVLNQHVGSTVGLCLITHKETEYLIASTAVRYLNVWRTDDGAFVRRTREHYGLECVHYSAALSQLFSAHVGKVLLWSPSMLLQTESVKPDKLLPGLDDVVTMALSDDETEILTVSKDGLVRFWNLCERREIIEKRQALQLGGGRAEAFEANISPNRSHVTYSVREDLCFHPFLYVHSLERQGNPIVLKGIKSYAKDVIKERGFQVSAIFSIEDARFVSATVSGPGLPPFTFTWRTTDQAIVLHRFEDRFLDIVSPKTPFDGRSRLFHHQQLMDNIMLQDGDGLKCGLTIDDHVHQSLYSYSQKRLFLRLASNQLEYVDLLDSTAESNDEESYLPRIQLRPVRPMLRESELPCQIFISHAGPDKEHFAIPLEKELKDAHLNVFLDKHSLAPGDYAHAKMDEAMQQADVGIFVLSPEFIARKWPMRELSCFIQRSVDARRSGETGPLLVAVYYRLQLQECQQLVWKDRGLVDNDNRPLLCEEGRPLLVQDKVFESLRRGELSFVEIQRCLKHLNGVTGFENETGDGNEQNRQSHLSRTALVKKVAAYVKAKYADLRKARAGASELFVGNL